MNGLQFVIAGNRAGKRHHIYCNYSQFLIQEQYLGIFRLIKLNHLMSMI
jgi:hypothetical protein